MAYSYSTEVALAFCTLTTTTNGPLHHACIHNIHCYTTYTWMYAYKNTYVYISTHVLLLCNSEALFV